MERAWYELAALQVTISTAGFCLISLLKQEDLLTMGALGN